MALGIPEGEIGVLVTMLILVNFGVLGYVLYAVSHNHRKLQEHRKIHMEHSINIGCNLGTLRVLEERVDAHQAGSVDLYERVDTLRQRVHVVDNRTRIALDLADRNRETLESLQGTESASEWVSQFGSPPTPPAPEPQEESKSPEPELSGAEESLRLDEDPL